MFLIPEIVDARARSDESISISALISSSGAGRPFACLQTGKVERVVRVVSGVTIFFYLIGKWGEGHEESVV